MGSVLEFSDSPQVIILGGGFSGTLLAVHLLRRGVCSAIDIVEPRPLGRGLAYSTVWDAHLLNVPAIRMSAIEAEPGDFLQWVRANGMPDAKETTFVPRRIFGSYVQHVFESHLKGTQIPVRQHFTTAESVYQRGSRMEVHLSSGQRIFGNRVVLAFGNAPSRPIIAGAASPYDSRAIAAVDPESSILLIGSGLTAVDAYLALKAQGHTGTVYAVSRRGRLPQAHQIYKPLREPCRPTAAQGIKALFRFVRKAVESETAKGADWRAVIDSLRPVTNQLWNDLGPEDRSRFLRHLKSLWDIHRHRMAPEIGAAIHNAVSSQNLQVLAGRISGVHASVLGQVAVQVNLRKGGEQTLLVSKIFNCSGVNEDYARSSNPVISGLIEDGKAVAGWGGRGLLTGQHGELIDTTGAASSSLFTIGTARIATLLETTAVPELRLQAESLANFLSKVDVEPVEMHPEYFLAAGI